MMLIDPYIMLIKKEIEIELAQLIIIIIKASEGIEFESHCILLFYYD